jgi:GxxExxY protein
MPRFRIETGMHPIQASGTDPRHVPRNRLRTGFRADFLIADDLIVEIKAVAHLLATHEAQALTYLRMSGCQVVLLLNFSGLRLKDRLRRFVRSRPDNADEAGCTS